MKATLSVLIVIGLASSHAARSVADEAAKVQARKEMHQTAPKQTAPGEKARKVAAAGEEVSKSARPNGPNKSPRQVAPKLEPQTRSSAASQTLKLSPGSFLPTTPNRGSTPGMVGGTGAGKLKPAPAATLNGTGTRPASRK
jgi:hypothetical protein